MTWENMPWSAAMLFLLCAVILLCIGYLLFDAWYHREKKRRIGKFDARVGRDVWRFIKGVHH